MTFLTGITHGRRERFFTLARHTAVDPPRSDPDHDGGFTLPRTRREAIAREAILAAARGARIDEGDISNILTQTVDQRGLSVTDIMLRAASMAEQYTGRQAFNWRSATPDQIARYLSSLGLEPGWRRAMREAERLAGARSSRDADDGDDGPGGSSLRYLGMDISRITPDNYTSTDFHRCGVDYGTFSELRSQGFSGQNIMNAARDAERLGFRGDRNAVRDHALIDRHSIDARGMNTALLDYRRRLNEDTELRALLESRRGATTDEERRRLDALIAARRLEHERASGLRDRIDNPGEDSRARDAAEGRRRAINEQYNQSLGLDAGVGVNASDAALQFQVIAPAAARQGAALVADQTTQDVAAERPNAVVAASLLAHRP
jgi:hypothetical protein